MTRDKTIPLVCGVPDHPGDLNNTAQPHTCGGIPMIYGRCYLSETGQFQRSVTSNTKDKLSADNSSSTAIENAASKSQAQGNSDVLPLCLDPIAALAKGGVFGKSHLANPKSQWYAHGCALLPARQPVLKLLFAEEEELRRARILIEGDSHERNIFNGFVHSARNTEFVAEAHPSRTVKGLGMVYVYVLWVNQTTGQVHNAL